MMDPMVGSSAVSDGGISDSSDNAALLDFCFLCSRQFFHDNLDNYGTERLKVEDILETFFEELGPVDRALLQCCPSCQTLCKSLAKTKEALSSLIDEITKLLLRSRKVSYLLSKSRVVSRLFQSSNLSLPPCEVSSSYLHQPLSQINFTKDISDNNSSNCFPTQFNLRLDSNNMSDDERLDFTLSHSNTSLTPKKFPSYRSETRNKTESIQEISAACSSSFSLNYDDSIMNSVSDNACDISEQVKLTQQIYKTSTGTGLQTARSQANLPLKDVTIDPTSSVLDISSTKNRENEKTGANNGPSKSSQINSKNLSLCFTSGAADCENEAKQLPSPSFLSPEACKNMVAGNTKTTLQVGKNLKCSLCDKSFRTAKNLKCHLKVHKSESKYICEVCGSSYKHKRGLDSHVAIHKGEPKFQCDVCCKTFTQKIGLDRHLRVHTRKFKFFCDKCGKQFLHHTSFAAHKLIHIGAKNFSCPHCDLTFLQNSALQRHLRVHTGDKPYSCSICGRPFSERYNLLAHIKSHEPDSSLAHKCTICWKTYTRKFKLKQHLKHIHNVVIK